MIINITNHAILRFQERVSPVSAEDAELALRSKAVELAASIGAPYVKLGTGQRIVLEGSTVVTVLPSDHKLARMWRYR